MRWPADGKSGNIGTGHDYNVFWPPEQVADFIRFMRPMLDQAGLTDVGVTPGECTNWYRFSAWGYADTIADDPGTLANLGLITSHGFYGGGYGRWFGEHRSLGTDILREKRPELHAWVTSTSWSKMDAANLKEMHGNIYTAKVNGIIPWACIQRPAKWVGGDPNPGTAFRVAEDGSYEVLRGYYYYQAALPRRSAGDGGGPDVRHGLRGRRDRVCPQRHEAPGRLYVVNLGKDKKVAVKVLGSGSDSFEVFRTTDEKDRYEPVGQATLEDDTIVFDAPAQSITTFFANEDPRACTGRGDHRSGLCTPAILGLTGRAGAENIPSQWADSSARPVVNGRSEARKRDNEEQKPTAMQVLACARFVFSDGSEFGGLVPDDSLGFSHASAFPLRRLLVVGRPLHIANQPFLLAQLLETSNHLLNGLA